MNPCCFLDVNAGIKSCAVILFFIEEVFGVEHHVEGVLYWRRLNEWFMEYNSFMRKIVSSSLVNGHPLFLRGFY